LRTPLAAITGATSALREGGTALDQAIRDELIDTAYDEAVRLNRLVGNLLDMTRIEAGVVQVQKEWQTIEEVIGAALAHVDHQLGQRTIRTNLPDDLPLVPLDSVLIEQLFINLLENAIKYTPPDSPIEISAAATTDGLTVEIADRGPGIPPSDIEHIFDKFYRVPARAGQRGAGLGLAICRGIVEAHGGRIWAENRVGAGALFRFSLPIDGPPRVNTDIDGYSARNT
jgi:two-component system sensor histidine kinase KdpD